jgi:Tol biopolymer transport system component
MMSNRSRDDFDRLMTSWMEAEGRVREPAELLDRTLDRTRAARRRPRWLVPEWWLSMQNTARLQAVWRPAPLLFLMALLLVALALVAILVGGSQPKVPAPFGPAANGSIVYDANGTIQVVTQTGSGVRTLVTSIPNPSGPQFSPDGTRLAFWGDNAPDSLYVADSEGRNVRRIATGLWITTDRPPDWSPDSRSIVLSTEGGPDRLDEHVVVIDVATGASVTIDRTVVGDARLFVPSWSPDGRWIAFVAMDRVSQGFRLWMARPDGSAVREVPTGDLTPTAVRPRWMPVGDRHVIAYDTVTTGPRAIAAFFDLDTGIEQRVDGPASEDGVWPAWSPDGSRLAWLGGPNPESIVLAAVAGTSTPNIVPGAGMSGPIGWSPDGSRIFGTAANDTELVIVTIDGSTPPVRLPHTFGHGLPDWQRLAP